MTGSSLDTPGDDDTAAEQLDGAEEDEEDPEMGAALATPQLSGALLLLAGLDEDEDDADGEAPEIGAA